MYVVVFLYIAFVSFLYISQLKLHCICIVFSYTRPFLVVSCSDNDTDVTNNIVVGSIASSMGHSMQTVLSNPLVDGQIHARNPKGLAERDSP